jgi:pimeloyl-ACP methyl ester carboxylesterase
MPWSSVVATPVRLHATAGGSGPLVVCLHSSGGSSSQWRSLIESGKNACRFLAFDFHGHGRSEEYRGEGYALRCESDAIWASIESVREPMHLVGHSFGGAVALDLALRHRGRFASATVFEPVLFALLDATTPEYREIASVGSLIAAASRAGDLEVAAAAFVDYWNGNGYWHSMAAEQRERVRARIAPVGKHFEALLADPVPAERLRSLDVPTRVLRGDRSPAPARAVSDRLAGFSCVTTEVLPGLGHMGPITDAEAVNRRISAWRKASSVLPMAA